MRNKQTIRIALLAVLAALTFVIGRFTEIPTPGGIITLLDAGIFTVSLTFGKREGAIVGGLAAFLIDFSSGYPQWMFFSLIIHGLQGFLGSATKSRVLNGIAASIVMVVGYFIAGWIIFNFTYSVNPAVWLPNTIQTIVGYLLGLGISTLLKKSGVLNGLK